MTWLYFVFVQSVFVFVGQTLATVREHLFIYARFRGLPERGMRAEVEEKIASVGLTSKAGCQAGTLSGRVIRLRHFSRYFAQ
jgi:ABC-type multidrug transport system ATPase subunit